MRVNVPTSMCSLLHDTTMLTSTLSVPAVCTSCSKYTQLPQLIGELHDLQWQDTCDTKIQCAHAGKYPVCHFASSSADAVHLFLPSCTTDLGLRYMSNRAWQKAFDWTRRLGVAELNWVKPGGYTSEVREPSTAQHDHDTTGYLACIHGCQIQGDPYSKQP